MADVVCEPAACWCRSKFSPMDLQQLQWPVLNVDQFPGLLHDVHLGRGPAQVSLLFGTGFVRILSISAESVRE